MGVDLIPLSIKSSTYENSTELDRKCPKPAASSIAINCAIKWRPADFVILSPAKAVSGTQIGCLYSLLQTCTANGVDGYAYLRALLIALPDAQTADDYEELLPWRITLPVH